MVSGSYSEKPARSAEHDVDEFYGSLFGPGSGRIFNLTDLQSIGSDTASAIGVGLRFRETLDAGPTPVLCEIDLQTGANKILTGTDGASLVRARFDGSLAWVITEASTCYLTLARLPGSDVPRIALPGHAEQLAWSHDGSLILIVLAGYGADLAGFQGGYALNEAVPLDEPSGSGQVEQDNWRSAWIYNVVEGSLSRVSAPTTNIWEAAWCGDEIAAIASDAPTESAWYSATVRLIFPGSGKEDILHVPRDQIGHLSCAPGGSDIAFVEAASSDRGLVCGVLKVANRVGRAASTIETAEVEVTSVSWRDDQTLHYAGLRGTVTVVAERSLDRGGAPVELWSSGTLTCGEWYPWSLPVGLNEALIVAEGYDQPPSLLRVSDGKAEKIATFAMPDALALTDDYGVMENFSWFAPDGRKIEGLLLRPTIASGHMPLILDIHGGPVWMHRPRWMARLRAAPLLVSRGYCILFPNPRGSSGFGQDFARAVRNDVGGWDREDVRAAIDELIAREIADPKRIGCTGTSYGGYLSAWLATTESRMATAVPISPVTDWASQHLTSQIPAFEDIFLEGSAHESGGQYVSRSPIHAVSPSTASCLILCGALDKNTPIEQALAFRNRLLEHGVKATLISYPNAGHSLRAFPEYLQSAAQVLEWFQTELAV
jgi:dipeptidyl aminopeptidase/acylaminoacyl peptidase